MQERIEKFVTLCQDRSDLHYNHCFPKLVEINCDAKLSIQWAQKFAKIWIKRGPSTSIFAFIDLITGDVFKPANTKAPAKHSRGNVGNSDVGMCAVYPDGQHIVYLRS